MSKQTAVDWLIEELTPSITLQQKHIDKLKEKAKEMEEQQIIDAVKKGWDNHENGKVRWIGEQYYNETFN